ncbi:MAG: hypothetical protein ACI9WU_005434, partial [Myxococcota bacterium]
MKVAAPIIGAVLAILVGFFWLRPLVSENLKDEAPPERPAVVRGSDTRSVEMSAKRLKQRACACEDEACAEESLKAISAWGGRYRHRDFGVHDAGLKQTLDEAIACAGSKLTAAGPEPAVEPVPTATDNATVEAAPEPTDNDTASDNDTA